MMYNDDATDGYVCMYVCMYGCMDVCMSEDDDGDQILMNRDFIV